MAEGRFYLTPVDRDTLNAILAWWRSNKSGPPAPPRPPLTTPQFIPIYGRITAAALISGEANRWTYTMVRTVDDGDEENPHFEDTTDEITAFNIAEEHNDGTTGQESNGVTVEAIVELIPIMTTRPIRIWPRGNGTYWFDTPNDVEVTCEEGGGGGGLTSPQILARSVGA